METWNERLKRRQKELGLTQAAIHRAIGVSNYTVSAWVSGKHKPEGANLVALCKVLRCNPDWLLTGRSSSHQPTIPAGAGVDVWEKPEDLDPARYVFVPHYDVSLSAGPGTEAAWVEHNDNDPLAFRARWFQARGFKPERCKALYVRGVSMEPTLRNSDTVLIDTQDTEITDDEIYALLIAGELFVKRLFRLPGGGIELRSDNPRHPPREIRGADLEQVIVLGRMIWRGG